MAWTKEQQLEASAKGAEARRAQAQLYRDAPSIEARARVFLTERAPTLVQELYKAAMGLGVYKELDLKQRTDLIIKALEFGIGRPAPTKAGPKVKDVPVEEGLEIT